MYLGLSPFDAPATYSMLAYTELAGGVWFPMGGLYRVVESLAALAQAQGVQLSYNVPVEQIMVADRRATGVRLQNGDRLDAELVIANADLPYVYRCLLNEGDQRERDEAERLQRLQFTSSSLMFFWGVDRVYPQLNTHNVFLAGDYQASFDSIFDERTLPGSPSFYVHAPARVDPAAAPAGEDTLYVLVPVGHLDAQQPQDWEALAFRARQAVLQRLAQHGIVDLASHIKFEVQFSPRDWEHRYHLEKGAGFGLSHSFTQVGYLRPHNRHAHYGNLYFVGSSTHPGAGLPMALLSARLVVERVLSEQGTLAGMAVQPDGEAAL
jgi:phytoene desaturase